VLADLGGASTRCDLLGQTLSMPLLLAPVAAQRLVHADGERAVAEAAAAMGVGMALSTSSSLSLEEVAGVARSPWFQLYIQPDRDFTLQLVRRAEAAGYRALVLTVDAPVNGVRNREQRAGFQLPEAVNLRGMRVRPAKPAGILDSPLFDGRLGSAPTWRDLDWLLGNTRLPVLLKGVSAAADAERAVQAGAAGLIVSNHGGRVLDSLPASIELLPRIADQVNGRVPLLLDGGIRRGTDMLKALALGAQAVLIGRPYVHALALGGAVGVVQLLNILRGEFEAAMALTGCATLADIDRGVLWQR
ncbi:alpha-hydroxy acid oxidase, partial [Pseudomonas sp. PS02288]|uniref:alpha-hydroxy acid oxidase n=1 Tax=Pseudomonas sp. PS02288 TaxID=2991443 RepID=UPI00249C56F8